MEATQNDVFRALNALTTFLVHTSGRAQQMQSAYTIEIQMEWMTHDKLWRDYNDLCCVSVMDSIALQRIAVETLQFCTRMMEWSMKLN